MPSEPSVLYEVPNMTVYHLADGHETKLNETPENLALMMVPTTTIDPFSENPQEVEDFYLHIRMLPNVDLPLPATTRIFRQYPRSYLIPRLDLDGGAGSNFTRIEFPERRSQDDVDTFETILAQCTAFLEKAMPPTVTPSLQTASSRDGISVSQTDYPQEKTRGSSYIPGSGRAAGDEYAYGSSTSTDGHLDSGRLVLIDENDGRIVGELSEGFTMLEQGGMEAGSKAPVEITLPTKAGNMEVIVQPVQPIQSAQYLDAASHPAYASSSLVSKAASASKMVVTAATYLASAMEGGAQKFTQSTQPVAEPLTFKPATHDRIRKIHTFTQGASSVSSKTLGRAQHIMQNFGAKVAGRERGEGNGNERSDKPVKPGLLNKSMIAFSTIADGIDAASRHLLASGGNAATTMVGHRYGDEAKSVAHGVTSSVRNVGLVYVDAAGVSRRAVVKSVAKGMVLGSVKGGGQVVVTSDNGSHGEIVYPQDDKNMSLSTPTSQTGNRPTTPTPPPYTLPGPPSSNMINDTRNLNEGRQGKQ